MKLPQEGRCQNSQTEIQALEAVTAAGRLITALAGRVIREVGEEAKLLDWTKWAKFQVAMLPNMKTAKHST